METKNKSKKLFQSYLIISTDTPDNSLTAFLKNTGLKFPKNSPDLLVLEPNNGSITIEEVRVLRKRIWQKPFEATHKLAVIKGADLLTNEAQNALLKVLEEPPNHAIFILTAKTPKNLLPTIISRVVTLNISQPEADKNEPAENITLDKLSEIGDPVKWIDQELENSYQKLLLNINNQQVRKQIEKKLELAMETKRMITANVNAKFAIANLLINSTDELN